MKQSASHHLETETPDNPAKPGPAAEEVRLQYCNGYYDGPISGVAEWKGKRYYFHMIEEADYCEDEETPPWYRRYALYELTKQEWAEEDERQASFETHVGTHTRYRDDGTRNHSGVRPQEGWANHYDRYTEPRPWDGPGLADRKVVHTFER